MGIKKLLSISSYSFKCKKKLLELDLKIKYYAKDESKCKIYLLWF